MDWAPDYWKSVSKQKLIVCKIGTSKSQVLHRMRLRPFTRGIPYPMYKSSHKNGNLIWKWKLNMIICMPELGNVTMKGHFCTSKMIMRRQPFQLKMQCGLICQAGNCGTHQEPQESGRQNFFPERRSFFRNRYVSLHGTWCGNELGTTWP